MAKIPERATETTLSRIDAITTPMTRRTYLGMSQINHSCARYLWYGFRWAYSKQIPARLNRIFKRGDLEEPRIVSYLESVGIQVYADQLEVKSCDGHAMGHIDGQVLGVIEAPNTPHLLEMKTMKASKFREFMKKGLAVAFPIYHGQAQRYMGKLKLTRALVIATNKDTEELHLERIEFDPVMNRELAGREKDIVFTFVPPPKIGNASWFECKWCDAKNVCHFGEKVNKSCRTCEHALIRPEGKWVCDSTGVELSKEDQLLACDEYTNIIK